MRLLRPLLALTLCAASLSAEVVRVEIISRKPLLEGRLFGSVGAYEIIVGTVHYAVDPANPRNAVVVDLDKAPRNSRGMVEFSGDIVILRPLNAAKGNGVTLIDVVNRGGITVMGIFNRGGGAEEVGDALLLERGYTLAFVGWEFDVATGIRLRVPSAVGVQGILTGGVVPNSATSKLLFSDIRGYSLIDRNSSENVLSVRNGPNGRAEVIARSAWSFAGDTVVLSAPATPGNWYSIALEAKDPPIAGLGFAAIRDVASWTKSQSDALTSNRFVIAFGNSQSGRFLRDFLYEGFNTDERGQRALDGVFANIAGAGRIDLNRRWSTPVSLGFHTATSYPFADVALRDPMSGANEGTLENARMPASSRPKIIYTNSGVEYWGGARAAALVTVTPDGLRDIELPPDVRVYFHAGAQHGAGAFPPVIGSGRAPGNPTNYSPTMRGLVIALDNWVRDGTAPPPSRYPRLSDQTLVAADSLAFPPLRAVGAPPRGYAGARVANAFIAGGAGEGSVLPYLVPRVDADGNEIAGVRLPDVAVPLATLTGWNYRNARIGGSDQLFPLLGSWVPFPATARAREAQRDPRRSVEERYSNEDAYLDAVKASAEALVKDRYILERDVTFILNRARATWQLVSSQKAPE